MGIPRLMAFAADDRGPGQGSSHGSDEGPGWIEVRGDAAREALERDLLSDARQEPVIAVTLAYRVAPREDRKPALSAEQVRSVAGRGAHVYFIASDAQLAHLRRQLGRRSVPTGGARIYWPDFTTHSNPADHPQVVALADLPEENLREFTRQFRLSHPDVRGAIRQAEDFQAHAEQRLLLAEHRLRTVDRDLRSALANLTIETLRRQQLARQLKLTQRMGYEEHLHLLILTQWLRGLTREERHDHPLRRLTFTDEFLAEAEQRFNVSIEDLAHVCAMAACDLPEKLRPNIAQPIPSGHSGRQAERAGAKGGRILLDRAGGLRLHYWTHPDSTIQFTNIGDHGE